MLCLLCAIKKYEHIRSTAYAHKKHTSRKGILFGIMPYAWENHSGRSEKMI
jgi:hypothetical protein